MPTLLSTAYLPPALWVAHAVQSDGIILEAHENFQKQSYRSRTEIAGPNGKQVLSVPVDRGIKDIRRTPLSYKEDWVKNHLRSIETAYANSPFFEVLFPDLEAVLNHRFNTLWELNPATIQLLFHWLEFSKDIEFTTSFNPSFHGHDARSLHPKRELEVEMPAYLQVFGEKWVYKQLECFRCVL